MWQRRFATSLATVRTFGRLVDTTTTTPTVVAGNHRRTVSLLGQYDDNVNHGKLLVDRTGTLCSMQSAHEYKSSRANDNQLHSSGCTCCQLHGKFNHTGLQRNFSSVSDKSNETESSISPSPSELDDDDDDDNSLSDIPGAQRGGKKLAIIFTCTVCDTRAAKQFTEKSYRTGVVIVQCPGCENKHLIADNLGLFEDQNETGGWNIEKAIAKMGGNVKVVTNDNVFEVSADEVFGSDAILAATISSNTEDQGERRSNTSKDN